MPSGGARSGTPGKAYPNRTDMPGKPLPVTTVPNQEYGKAGAQAAAQQLVPMASTPAGAGAPGPPQPAPAGPLPGAFGDFAGPSERPDEPITAGLTGGPGPGPEALGMSPDPVKNHLVALYQKFPNEDLRALLESMETGAM